MNRILSILLVLSLLVMLSGCIVQDITPTDVASTKTPITESVVSETQPASKAEESTVSKEENSLVSPLPAELDYSPKEGVPREELILCTKTTEDDYVLGTIHVGIQLTYSKVNRVWTAQHFPELSGIVEIEDLTYVETQEAIERFEQKENFHQLLSIRISDQSKEAVIDGIKALEKSNPYIYCVATQPTEQQHIEE